MILNLITASLFGIASVLFFIQGNIFCGVLDGITSILWFIKFFEKYQDHKKYTPDPKKEKRLEEDKKTLDYYTKK